MTTVLVPRPINGSIGSRIRVILGDTGDEWLLLLENDDGDAKWQTKDWNNIPCGVAKQINNCTAKDRDIKHVDFGPTGAWYINGAKSDGTGVHSWWGGDATTIAGDEMKELTGGSHTVKVTFGGILGIPTYVLINGRNGYSSSGLINLHLQKRMEKIHKANKEFNFVRLFDEGKYFISDDEGTSWEAGDNEHIDKELRNNSGNIHDVAIAGDGTWIVIRDNKFVASEGVDSSLDDQLTKFYNDQRRRFNNRKREIADARRRITDEDEREHRECEEREEYEHQEAMKMERMKRECLGRLRVQREAEAARLNAASRVSALEAQVEGRAIEDAKDIKEMEKILLKRKRSLQESLQCLPASSKARFELDISDRGRPQANTCVVCHDKEAEIAIAPCGHCCLCSECNGTSIHQCPLCRGPVQSTLKIFYGH